MNGEQSSNEMPPLPAVRPPWVRSLLLGMAILICGAVIGGVVSAAMFRTPKAYEFRPGDRLPEDIAQRMRGKYQLSEEQTEKLRAVFEEHGEKLAEIRAEVHPRIEAEHEALRRAVEAVLSPEQAQAWREEFESMRRPWGPRGGTPPPYRRNTPR